MVVNLEKKKDMKLENLEYFKLGRGIKLPSYVVNSLTEEFKLKVDVKLSDSVYDLVSHYISEVYDKAYQRGFIANNDREINYVIDCLDVTEMGLVAYYRVIHLVKELLHAVQKCGVYNSQRHYR